MVRVELYEVVEAWKKLMDAPIDAKDNKFDFVNRELVKYHGCLQANYDNPLPIYYLLFESEKYVLMFKLAYG